VLLLAVLEVDGPDEVTIRRGREAGQVVSMLRLIVGGEASTIGKLTGSGSRLDSPHLRSPSSRLSSRRHGYSS